MSQRKSRRAGDIEARTTSNYPLPFSERVRGRRKRPLAAAFGLDQFGVNLTELAPGSVTALRHWHSAEDEFVYVLEGELILITDAGEEELGPGDCVGFKAGVPDGHHLANRSSTRAVILEVGSRRPGEDEVRYPDDDLAVEPDGSGRRRFVTKDGSSY